jgi:hypothetical protein
MNCKTCKHWEHHPKRDVEHYGACSNPNFIYGTAQYDRDREKSKFNELFYWDSESWAAGFETGENFGCIHWEPSPVPK